MARGYPDARSTVPGGTLVLHVASDSAKIRFDFFRQGTGLSYTGSSPWFDGPAPAGSPAANVDFAWKPFSFDIPGGWSSGVYIAAIVEWDGNGQPPSVVIPTSSFATDGMLLFVLRSADPGSHATMLYKLSLFTYHAYNITGGGAFYVQGIASVPPDPPGGKVTLLRPGGGTGGDLAFPGPDPYDPNSHPQSFSYWDAPFVSWLESQGFAVDYCTDLDIHVDGTLPKNYRLLLSVGHDEYWSEPMRSNIESFIASGGNVAYFSGNTCWWRVHLVNADTAMVCLKGVSQADDQWWNGLAQQPENTVTGVSYRNAGGWWGTKRSQVGYTIQFSDHWVFAGTGLADGATFGDVTVPPIVGYECDGARLAGHGSPPWQPSLTDQTPASIKILGVGLLTQAGDGNTGWSEETREDPTDPPNGPPRAATMGVWANNGVVFTAATCEWPRVVARGDDPSTRLITRNVLNTLSNLNSVDVTSITGRSIAGPATSWQTPDGPFLVEHLAAVDANGHVLVFFWSPRADWQVVDVSAITGRMLAPGAPLTSWQTPDGSFNVEHLAGVDGNGKVVVFFWSPRADWQAIDVSAIAGRTLTASTPLTSWQTTDGQFNVEHLAGTDNNGHVVVLFWSPRAAWQGVDVSAISGRSLAAGVSLTSWQTPDGPFIVEHLAGVDASGKLVVFFWSPRADWQSVEVTEIAGQSLAKQTGLASWQVPDGQFIVEHVAGVDRDGDAVVFFWSPQSNWQAVNVSAIAGSSLDDKNGLTSWQLTRVALNGGPLVVEKLAGINAKGAAKVFSWSPAHDWSAFDVSKFTSVLFARTPTSWQVPDGPFMVEHLAGPTIDGRLVLIYWEAPTS
jgi:hypothetical protein